MSIRNWFFLVGVAMAGLVFPSDSIQAALLRLAAEEPGVGTEDETLLVALPLANLLKVPLRGCG